MLKVFWPEHLHHSCETVKGLILICDELCFFEFLLKLSGNLEFNSIPPMICNVYVTQDRLSVNFNIFCQTINPLIVVALLPIVMQPKNWYYPIIEWVDGVVEYFDVTPKKWSNFLFLFWSKIGRNRCEISAYARLNNHVCWRSLEQSISIIVWVFGWREGGCHQQPTEWAVVAEIN